MAQDNLSNALDLSVFFSPLLSVQDFASPGNTGKKPQKTVDGSGAVRIMRRSLAGGGTAKGVKKALLSVDRVDAACIMVGLLGALPSARSLTIRSSNLCGHSRHRVGSNPLIDECPRF